MINTKRSNSPVYITSMNFLYVIISLVLDSASSSPLHVLEVTGSTRGLFAGNCRYCIRLGSQHAYIGAVDQPTVKGKVGRNLSGADVRRPPRIFCQRGRILLNETQLPL
jgi:hypothetical protein